MWHAICCVVLSAGHGCCTGDVSGARCCALHLATGSCDREWRTGEPGAIAAVRRDLIEKPKRWITSSRPM
jgi:hypothetical protein